MTVSELGGAILLETIRASLGQIPLGSYGGAMSLRRVLLFSGVFRPLALIETTYSVSISRSVCHEEREEPQSHKEINVADAQKGGDKLRGGQSGGEYK